MEFILSETAKLASTKRVNETEENRMKKTLFKTIDVAYNFIINIYSVLCGVDSEWKFNAPWKQLKSTAWCNELFMVGDDDD